MFNQVRYSNYGMDSNWRSVTEVLQENPAVEKVCSSAGISLETTLPNNPQMVVSHYRTHSSCMFLSTPVLFIDCCFVVVFSNWIFTKLGLV